MEKQIDLSFTRLLRQRIDSGQTLIQVVLGPRQVGKTTTTLKLIDEHYKDRALYVSADQVFSSDALWLREQWNTAHRRNQILFVDEIQKIENWASAVKHLYDQSRRDEKLIHCVLLGSSSLAIQKGLTESLTGRFQLIRAHHWNFSESRLGYGLTLDQCIRFGGYPGSYRFGDTREWADCVKNSIISTVVEKDILQFHTVKSPALFRQAFELLCSYPAQEISYTKLLGQLQDRGNVELVKNYIALYEGAYLIRALEKFSNKAVLKRASSPKILPLAPCLSFLQLRGEAGGEIDGRLFEVLVGNQLIRTGEDLYYWREKNREVDFVLQRGRETWAIEVKSGRKKNTGGLLAFKERFPKSKQVIITRDSYPDFEADPMRFLDEHIG